MLNGLCFDYHARLQWLRGVRISDEFLRSQRLLQRRQLYPERQR